MNEDAWRDDVIQRLVRIETKVDGTCEDIEADRKAHERLRNKVEAQGRDIARLQVKAGLWGAIAGAIGGFLGGLGIK